MYLGKVSPTYAAIFVAETPCTKRGSSSASPGPDLRDFLHGPGRLEELRRHRAVNGQWALAIFAIVTEGSERLSGSKAGEIVEANHGGEGLAAVTIILFDVDLCGGAAEDVSLVLAEISPRTVAVTLREVHDHVFPDPHAADRRASAEPPPRRRRNSSSFNTDARRGLDLIVDLLGNHRTRVQEPAKRRPRHGDVVHVGEEGPPARSEARAVPMGGLLVVNMNVAGSLGGTGDEQDELAVAVLELARLSGSVASRSLWCIGHKRILWAGQQACGKPAA
jgi:hypothetical protein